MAVRQHYEQALRALLAMLERPAPAQGDERPGVWAERLRPDLPNREPQRVADTWQAIVARQVDQVAELERHAADAITNDPALGVHDVDGQLRDVAARAGLQRGQLAQLLDQWEIRRGEMGVDELVAALARPSEGTD